MCARGFPVLEIISPYRCVLLRSPLVLLKYLDSGYLNTYQFKRKKKKKAAYFPSSERILGYEPGLPKPNLFLFFFNLHGVIFTLLPSFFLTRKSRAPSSLLKKKKNTTGGGEVNKQKKNPQKK